MDHLGTPGLSWDVAAEEICVSYHPLLVISSLGVVPPGTALAFNGARCLRLVTALGNWTTTSLSIIHDQARASGREKHQEYLEAQTRVSR